jgi:hypothetical protein
MSSEIVLSHKRSTLMAKAKKKPARKSVAAALKVMENMVFETTDLDAQIKQVREKLSPHGVNVDFGTIIMAGRRHSDRSGLVQVDVPSTGNNPGQYSSPWPEWAYGVAEGALRFNKQVVVLYNDVPLGANLILVYCMNS